MQESTEKQGWMYKRPLWDRIKLGSQTGSDIVWLIPSSFWKVLRGWIEIRVGNETIASRSLIYFTMSTAYSWRYEALFLCSHLKGQKISYGAAAEDMKWVGLFRRKSVSGLLDCDSVQKATANEGKVISGVFMKNHWLSLGGGPADLR